MKTWTLVSPDGKVFELHRQFVLWDGEDVGLHDGRNDPVFKDNPWKDVKVEFLNDKGEWVPL